MRPQVPIGKGFLPNNPVRQIGFRKIKVELIPFTSIISGAVQRNS
jgi:hypothetical protein